VTASFSNVLLAFVYPLPSASRLIFFPQLKRYTERSDNWIGGDCGISYHTIRVIREELEASLEISKLTKFKAKDGKTYPREQEKREEAERVSS